MLQASSPPEVRQPEVWKSKFTDTWNTQPVESIIERIGRAEGSAGSSSQAVFAPRQPAADELVQSDLMWAQSVKLGPPPVNRATDKALQIPRAALSKVIAATTIDPLQSLASLTASLAVKKARHLARNEQPLRVSAPGTIELEAALRGMHRLQVGSPKKLEIHNLDVRALHSLLLADHGSLLVASLSMGERIFATVSATNGKLSKKEKLPRAVSSRISFAEGNQAFPKVKTQNVKRMIASVFAVGEAALGVSGTALPGAAIGTTAAATGMGLFNELALEYAWRSGALTDVSILAAKLAEISNGIQEKAQKGLYVPSMKECTDEQFDLMKEAGGPEFASFFSDRKKSGLIFHQAYERYLNRYKQGSLEAKVIPERDK